MPITPPATLVRHLQESRCVLFAGAGLSAAAGYPNWSSLLRKLIDALGAEAPDASTAEELERMMSAGKLLDVADHCKERLGPRTYLRVLEECLAGGTPSETHKLVAQLPFTSVVTTNYDQLLEYAYRDVTAKWPKAPTHKDTEQLGPLLFDGSFFVLKAHGDIQRSDTLVLTTRDYREVIHGNPAFSALFSAILMTRAVLFLGYSLSDPDFRLLLDRQLTMFKGNVPERYAVMSGVGSVERDVLWRTACIRVLPYPDGEHDEVPGFLRSLGNAVRAARAQAAAAAQAAGAPAMSLPPSSSIVLPASVSQVEVRLRVVDGRIDVAFEASSKQKGETLAMPAGARAQNSVDWASLGEAVDAALRRDHGSRTALEHLGRLLARILPVDALEQIPVDRVIRLHLSPELEPWPWELALIGNRHFGLRQPLARAPVNIADSVRGYPHVTTPTRVLLIGDPTQDEPLQGARAEVEQIAALYKGQSGFECTCLVAPEATFQNVVRHLLTGGFDVVHFAGHAWFDEQESYLILERKDVIVRANELRSLLSGAPPTILILNSHYTSFAPAGLDVKELARRQPIASNGEKPMSLPGHGGFTQAATTTGVGAFIGSMGSPEDIAAKEVGVKIHEELLAGASIAHALHRARLSVWDASARLGPGAASAALYSLSGYGDCALRHE